MDFAKIKNLVKQSGNKFIFIENGEPELVVMSFHEYEKLCGDSSPISRNIRVPYESRPEIKSEPLIEETEFMPPSAKTRNFPVRIENVRLEDLPL